MDEAVMLAWVDGPLKAYVNTAPEGIVPLLILDSYRCHMMALVVQRIQEMGVEEEMKNENTIVKNAWLKTGFEWFQDWGI